jgi:hypothetical protein
MTETYRKFGRTLRYENRVTLNIEESGEAVEEGQIFRCRPIPRTVDVPSIDSASVQRTVRELEVLVRSPLVLERVVVSEGIAEHQFGDRVWRETTRRIHLAIAFHSSRALIDLGDFDLSEVRAVVDALARIGDERAAPPRVRLAPNVAAALLPSLIGVVPPNVHVLQSGGELDGKGQPIEPCDASRQPWPNWYRPSYRARPVRAPFHLRATSSVTQIDADLPRAVALLAPPERLQLRALFVDGSDVFPATIRVARIDAVAEEARWYPYGAGSFGSEMML